MRLGEFLMARGKISKADVDGAREMQNVNNHMIGVLAVDRGWMSVEQLERVLHEQSARRPHELFGTLAIETGFLSVEQVSALLNEQSQNRLRIGEVLVLQSRISEGELIDELRAFGDHLREAQRKSA